MYAFRSPLRETCPPPRVGLDRPPADGSRTRTPSGAARCAPSGRGLSARPSTSPTPSGSSPGRGPPAPLDAPMGTGGHPCVAGGREDTWRRKGVLGVKRLGGGAGGSFG